MGLNTLCTSWHAQVLQLQLVLARRSIAAAPRAVKDEQAELDRIVKEANQGDMWDNELVGNAVKVCVAMVPDSGLAVAV